MEYVEIAGWIATDKDETAICGYGECMDDALDQAVEESDMCAPDGNLLPVEQVRAAYTAHPASQALLDRVEKYGGAIAWDYDDGVAVLPFTMRF